AFELSRVLECSAAPLVERRDVARRRLELLDACAEIFPVDGDRFDLRVEHLEHRAKVRAERPRADRARSALAQLDDVLALALYVAQLIEQRLPARLRFLLVAHPLVL